MYDDSKTAAYDDVANRVSHPSDGDCEQDAAETHMEATVLEEVANQTDHRFLSLQR
jgi:hypothetical protein